MRVLITGINGFVGRYLEACLRGQGHEVFGFEAEGPREKENVFYGDIRDGNVVGKAVRETAPERVYHLAAISFVPHSDINEMYHVNFLGTLNLCEALKKAGREVRLLFVSSSNVYGIVPREMQPIRETLPLSPVNHYAVSKAGGELLSRAYRGTAVKVVIARPFNHTGVGQSRNFVVPKIVHAYVEKEKSLQLGNIAVSRDFSDVRDVVRAYSMLLEKGEEGEAYNISSGRTYSIRDILNALSGISGHTMLIEQDPGFMRSTDIPYILGDNSRLAGKTGWRPEITFADTLRWMYDEDRH